MNHRLGSFLRLILFVVLVAGLALPPQTPVYAAAILDVKPITWNIIGLDSNNVSVGPNHFPIGAQVCNIGDAPANNVRASFVWDSANSYINLRPGTAGSGTVGAPGDLPASGTINLPSTPGSNCTEFYFEVEVSRNSAAYDTTRRYHIAVTADGGATTGSTPTPRELYVEHLVSQSRNAVTNVLLDNVSIPAGGTMTLAVGNTYKIRLEGYTATQGYNQLESFINFPNTIFQVNSVTSTFTAGTTPITTLYADACGWDNVLSSPTYRSCIVSDNKSGGTVSVTYDVTILKVPAAPLVNPEPLSTLLYDFSGSSYHYNSDYGISTRFAQIVDASNAVTISKAFSPSTIPPGGSSTLTVTLTNTSAVTISGANFSDNLPTIPGGQMVVATPAVYSSSGCGSVPILTFAPAQGATSFSVAGATIAPNGSCTLSVGVSVPSTPTTGTYTNQITNFKVGSSPTAGISSNTANLTVDAAAGSSGTGLCGVTLASWNYTGAPAGILATPYNANILNVATAAMTWGNGLTAESDTVAAGGNPQPGALTYGWQKNAPVDTAASAYIQFAVNTNQYSGVQLRFDAQRKANGPTTSELHYSTNGTAWNWKSTFASTTGWLSYPSAATYYDFTGQTNPTGVTYFRIYGYGANATSKGNDITVDNVTFTGCGPAAKPILSKNFNTNPVTVNGTSTLSFTITNPNATATLHGIQFTDVLPAGLTITDSGPTTVCGGTLTTTAASGTITFTGGVLAGGASCTITTPAVTATTAGPHPNVSGFISSTESGTNSTSTGSAKASLVAVLPPSIEKVFNPNPIIPGQNTKLTFTITNPNPSDLLTNVAFTDTFPITPGAMTVAAPLTTTNTCGGTLQDNLGGTLAADAVGIQLTGASIAGGSDCVVTVIVKVPEGTTGSYDNTTSAVTTTIGGQTRGTDTASSTLTVNPPSPSFTLSKQISTNASGPWSKFLTVAPGGTVYYKFTLENTGDVPLTLTAPVLNDPNVNTSSCTWPATLPVGSPSSNPTATCTVSVTALAGDHPNTATAAASYGGNTYSSTSSADYFGATSGLNLLKQVSTSASGPWSNSIANVPPGSNIYYRFTVVNTSALTLSTIAVVDPQVSTAGCTFTDPLPANNATSCVVGPVVAALSGSASHTNTAHATGVNGGTTYPSPDSTASYTLALPSLGLTKSNSATAVTAGGTTTYSLTVANSGSTPTSGLITVVDVLPAGLSILDGAVTLGGANAADWSCTAASNVLTCTSSTVIAASGNSVFNFTANVAANAAGTLLNKAQVGGGGDTGTSTPTVASVGNCTGVDAPTKGCATDSDTVNLTADLSITKTDNSATYIPGTAIRYTVVVTNSGPSPVTNAAITDTIPANITGATWTCAASTGASCTASGSGNINDTVTIPANGNVTYTVIGVVSGTATGSLANTAAANTPAGTTDPVPGNNTSTDTDTPAACVSGPFASWTFTGDSTNAATGVGFFAYDTVGLNPPTWPISQVGADTPAISFTGAQNGSYTANSDYVDFAVPTNGRGAISMSFIDYRSGTGPDSFVIYYSADGTTYTALPPGTVYAIADTAWTPRSINFSSITALNNNSTAHFRIYPYRIAPGGSGLGTWRLDNVSFSGDCAADVVVTKTLDTAAPYTVGQSLTYTLTVTNNGPAAATGISVADTPTNLTVTNVTSPTMTCAGGNAFPCTLANLANGSSATITVTAAIIAPGAFDNSVSVTSTSPDPNTTNNTDNTDNGGTALPTIDAVIDDFSSAPINGGAGGKTASVITNDTTNGVAAVIGTNVTLTPGASPNAGLTMNPDGTITVAAGTPAGTYKYPYQICTLPATTPPTCDSTEATVVVSAATITANDDSANTTANTPVTTLVTTNDTTTGGTIDPGSVTVTIPPASGSVICTSASCVYTPPASFVGTVTYTYQVCLIAPNASVCDTAVVTVTVRPTIDAVNNDFSSAAINGGVGGTTASVITNDTTNGIPAVIGTNVTLNPGASPNAGLTMNANGTITVAAGTTPGTYTYPYEICTLPATTPPTCDTADATVVVSAPTITANDDTSSTLANTSVTTTVTGNDSNVGGSIAPGSVTVTILPASGSVLCTGASCVYTPPVGFAGTVTYTYEVCLAAPYTSVCDTAVVTVNVTPTIDAVDNNYGPINGFSGGTTTSVLGNDTTNGAAAVLGTNVSLNPGVSPNAGLTMNTNGTITVAAGTAAGTYSYPYQICTLPATAPPTCDSAVATVNVSAAPILAVNDSAGPVNGLTGAANVLNVFTNDTLNGVAVIPANVTLTRQPGGDTELTLNSDGSVDVAAGTPAGTYTFDYRICENLNPTNCSTATVTVTVGTPVIDAVDNNFASVNGLTGGTTASVLANDTLNGAAVIVGAGGNVTLTPGTAPTPASGSITMNPNGTIAVAPGTTAGSYAYSYTICDVVNTSNCDTATATVNVSAAPIVAVADNAGPVNGLTGAANILNVFSNDTLNGVAVIPANVTLTRLPGGDAELTLNPNGSVDVAPGTPAGTYTFDYRICENLNPTNCSTTTVIVTVALPVIDAVDNNFASVNGLTGGVTLSVLGNDTLNGGVVSVGIGGNVTLTPAAAPTPVTGSITMNPNGTITVAPGTTAGIYNYSYTICDVVNLANCDTAVATVTVSAAPILAVNDSAGPVNGLTGAANVLNVFTNDTLNGVAVIPANVTLTRQPGGDAELTLNSDGSVDVPTGTPAGPYTFNYQICEKLNPTNCSIATVSVTVGMPVIDAVNNTFGPLNGTTGATTASVLANDTLNGAAVTVGAGGNVTLTPGAAPTPASGSITMNPNGTITVAPGTTAGSYAYSYTICDVVNTSNCDTATATVIVVAAPIDAVDDSYGPFNGFVSSTTASVLANDTLNGAAVTVGAGGNAVLTPGAAPVPALGSITMNADGTITVAAGTTAGTYNYQYTICEVLNPVNCDTAAAAVTVIATAINAVNDDYSGTPIDGAAGGNAGNAFTNDTLNGAAVVLAQITAKVTTPASVPGVTLNLTTGSVDVAAGTPAGSYTITYEICEKVNPTNCDTATITVLVNPPASISGVIFHDTDLNGTKAAGESGLSGVTVRLYDSTGTTLIATTTTGAGGTYSFPSLTPGSYTVVEIDPAGYVSSTLNSVPVTIAAGGSGTANFGDYQLPNTALSSISGIVYEDANANGTQDAGEVPLSGVTVELRNHLGTVVGAVVTSAAGTYNFPGLSAGSYTVTETDPAGYVSTTLNNVAVSLSAGTNATVRFGDQTGAALIADPAVTKFGTPNNAVVGDTVVYTITVGNNGTLDANNVVLTDTKPVFLDIIAITIAPNPGLVPVISGNTFTINFGTVTPTDFYTVTVLTRVNSLGVPPGGANTVRILSTSASDRLANNTFAAGLTITSSSATPVMPRTGFAPHVRSEIMPQPQELMYAATDIVLEIPSLGIKLPVLGVPKKNGEWDVTWLGDQAGWLEGTAFPSWNGNSVLTSHVYLSNGLPGPFVNMGKLKYGDKVIVHAYGQKYTFEVRTNAVVEPNDTSALKHEENPWLTLVTCKEYDEKTNTYKKRVVVRAVLVKVEPE